MERILQNTNSQISATFYSGSTAADPGVVTVAVVRDDGTTVATGSTGGTGAAARTFTLTTAHTALLDRLTVSWVSASLGTITTTVEVVGGFLFTTAELDPLVPAATTDAQIQAARTRVEQTLEDTCGLAFVPRYDRAKMVGRFGPVRLRPVLRTIRWAKLDGIAMAPADVAALTVDPVGFVRNYTGTSWPSGTVDGERTTGYFQTIEVGFEHGMDRPPEPVRAAALDYARFLLTQDTSIDSRTERLVTDDGTLVFGGKGATPLPSVNQVIDSYRMPVIA